MEIEDSILEGVRLFNGRKFFEAHEALEAVWLKAEGHRKTLLHGLIQVAVGLHHHTRGNPAGFHSLLEKGYTKLERFGAEAEGLDLAGFMLQLRLWRKYLERSLREALPPPNQTDSRMIEQLSDRKTVRLCLS